MTIKPIDLSLVPKNSKYPSHVYKGLTDNVTIDKLYHALFPEYELTITSDWYENITKQLVDFNLVPDGDLVVNNDTYNIRFANPKEPITRGETYISIIEGDFSGYEYIGLWVNRTATNMGGHDYIGGGFWVKEFTVDVNITNPNSIYLFSYPSSKTPKKNNLRYWGLYKKSDLLKIQLKPRAGIIHVCDGSNMLLNSHVPVTNSDYLNRSNDLIEKPINGEWYTVTIKAKLGKGKSGLMLCNSGSAVDLVKIQSGEFNSEGIVSKSFVWRNQKEANGRVYDADDSHVRVYISPSTLAAESTIYWIKLEKGKESTGYSKAPSELITTESNRNLMDLVSVSGHLLSKHTQFGKTLAHIISSTAATGGLSMNLSNLEPNTRYCLSYEITKLSGSVTRIGGHADPWVLDPNIYIDGALKSYTYRSPEDETILNDGKRHSIKVYFTTGKAIRTSKLMYIQPNRAITTNYEVLITHIMLSKNEASWEPVAEDIQATEVRTKPYTYQPDNKIHYLPYSYQVSYSDSIYKTSLSKSRHITSNKSTSINPATPEQYVTIPLSRVDTIWKETETVSAIDFARTVVNDVSIRAEDSYVKTSGVTGSKTLYTTIETILSGAATGNVVKDYEVVTKDPTNEVYIQGTAVVTWKREVYKTEPIPYNNINQNTDTLYVGDTKVSQTGIAGVRSYYRDNEYMNGTTTGATRNVDTTGTITTQPVNQITQVGTKPREASMTVTATDLLFSTFYKGDTIISFNSKFFKDYSVGEKAIKRITILGDTWYTSKTLEVSIDSIVAYAVKYKVNSVVDATASGKNARGDVPSSPAIKMAITYSI